MKRPTAEELEAAAFARVDAIRDQAERDVARQFPVAFALWDSFEDGISVNALAAQTGIAPVHVKLLAAVADWLIDRREYALLTGQ